MIKPDATALVEFVEADPVLKSLCEDILSPLLLANDSIPNWFNYAVAEGIMRVTQLNYNNKPLAIVWYRIDGSKFIIEWIQAVNKADKIGVSWYQHPLMTRGFTELAKSFNCTVLEAKTRRKAVISTLREFGWIAESINIQKKVT